MSDPDGVENYRENDQLDVDTVFRPSKDTTFSRSFFNNSEMGSMAGNPILIDEEQDKEISPPPHPTTPVSERQTQPPVLMRSHPFDTRIENVPDYVFRSLFH